MNTKTMVFTERNITRTRTGKVKETPIETFSVGSGKIEGKEPTFSVTVWTKNKAVRLEMSKQDAHELADYIKNCNLLNQ